MHHPYVKQHGQIARVPSFARSRTDFAKQTIRRRRKQLLISNHQILNVQPRPSKPTELNAESKTGASEIKALWRCHGASEIA